uniref:RNA-dependent RNA polymerase n=1 Tax=Ulva durnavirus 1 TaxID=3051521 RepID=A0A9Y1YTA2_9VIRU|nr:MAG: RNA-dependent RNA polymerase [Ulva durnavirus 1]
MLKLSKQVYNYKYNDKKFIVKFSKKMKQATLFNFKTINGVCRKYFKRVSINDFVNYFSDKYCKVVGYTPNYVGMAPSKVIKNRSLVVDIFNKNGKRIKQLFPKIYKSLIKSLNNYRQVYQGGFDTSINHFRSYGNENEFKPSWNECFAILEQNNFKWFYAPIVRYNNPNEIFHITNFNKESSPGHFTKLIYGVKRKFSIAETSIIAIEMFNYLKYKPLKNWFLWEILGREKDVKCNESGKEVATRVVMNTEEPAMLLLSLFCQKLTKPIINDDNGRCLIGRKYDVNKSKRVIQNKRKFKYSVDCDWSSFDTYCSSQVIELACDILMSNLPVGDKFYKRVKYYVKSSLITKFIAIPPGVVFRIDKGVPSGHPFTSIITSYINLIIWSVIGYRIYGKNYIKEMDIVVCGDDAKVFFNESPNLRKIDKIIKQIGMKSDPVYNNLTLNSFPIDKDKEPDFLKRILDIDGVIWNNDKVIDKLVYQSKSNSIEKQIKIIENFAITAPNSDEFNEFCKYVLDFYELESNQLKEIESYKKQYLCGSNPLSGYFFEKSVITSVYEYIKKFTKTFSIRRMEQLFYNCMPPNLYRTCIKDIRRLKFDVGKYNQIREISEFDIIWNRFQ